MFKILQKFSLAALIMLLILTAIVGLQFCVIYNPIKFNRTDFDEMANWEISFNSSEQSAVQLPRKYQHLSVTGQVYVTGNCIFVPSWIGRETVLPSWLSNNTDCEGYLFDKASLPYDKPAGDIDQVTIYIPAFSGLYNVARSCRVMKSTMFVRYKLNANWYAVESPPKSVLE